MTLPDVVFAGPGESPAVAAENSSSPAAGQPRQDHGFAPPRWLGWLQSHPGTVIVGLVAVILLPFIAKPFHIDDPMYLWAGRHIVRHPFDFYGLHVFWTGSITPMWWLNQNPPLTSYFTALATVLMGAAMFGAALDAADFSLVAASRRTSEGVAAVASIADGRLWFQGNWGFRQGVAGSFSELDCSRR